MISPITDIPQNCHIADWYIAHSDSDNDSGNTKKVVSIDNPRTDQGCNINMNRKANTGSITGDQIDCKAETLSVTITKDGNTVILVSCNMVRSFAIYNWGKN